jgi:hypothetical protein
MYRYAIALLCLASGFTGAAEAQKTGADRLTVPAGAVLRFHLQTRLNPDHPNEIDALPRGTLIHVKLLTDVDSNVDHDGSEFRGQVTSAIVSGNQIVVHKDSEVRGLLVLLRSRNHPEGFRYELLVTTIIDHDKAYDLTASRNPSLSDSNPDGEAPAASNAQKGQPGAPQAERTPPVAN